MDERRRGIVMGRHTAAKVEAAALLRREMTPAERALWERLRANRLGGYHFRRQQVIDGLIADFYCHAAGLVVEVDGPVHERQRAYDAERDGILRQRGLRVLRVRNEQVLTNVEEVLDRILAACEHCDGN